MNKAMTFHDRYSATGRGRPTPKTVCQGMCEGMGCVPIKGDEKDPAFLKLWQEAEAKEPTKDGYHFVECPVCKGTGKKGGAQ